MYRIKQEQDKFLVVNSRGKLQGCFGSREDAEKACQRYVEEDRWEAANR